MLSLLLLSSLTEAKLNDIKRMVPKTWKISKQLKNYGCHCWRKNDEGTLQLGFGDEIPIVDPIDQACFDLAMCYEAAETDFGIDRNSRYKWSYAEGGEAIDCSRNKNDGQAAICACDGMFAKKLVGDEFPNARRRSAGRKFAAGSHALITTIDMKFWGHKKNRNSEGKRAWNPKKTCVADADDELFCSSEHVKQCFNHCGSCFLIREMEGCLEDQGRGCGTCDGCTFSGWEDERCLDSERCWEDFHCNNGRRDASEQGIDCGGSCPTSCAEAGDVTPLCEQIRDDGACGKSCTYIFHEDKFTQAEPAIIPHWLVETLCTDPESTYSNICPTQCACENQRNAILCERGGLCKWEPDTTVDESRQISIGKCFEPSNESADELVNKLSELADAGKMARELLKELALAKQRKVDTEFLDSLTFRAAVAEHKLSELATEFVATFADEFAFVDKFAMADQLALAFAGSLALADNLALVDSLALAFADSFALADKFALADRFALAFAGN